MIVRNMGTAIVLMGMLTAVGHAVASDETSTQLIGLAASMNEIAVACGHMSASEVAAAQLKQRQAMLDQGVGGKEYDKAYADAKAGFVKKWQSGSKQQQQSSCAQIKAQSEQGAAAARKMLK